jgi:hypothetical protein
MCRILVGCSSALVVSMVAKQTTAALVDLIGQLPSINKMFLSTMLKDISKQVVSVNFSSCD